MSQGEIGLIEAISSDQSRVLEALMASIWRNVSAEAWFYGTIFGALAFGVGADIWRRRNLRERYLSAGMRVDLVYAGFELIHLIQLLVIVPVSIAFTGAFRTWLPWATFDVSAYLPGWAQLLLLFLITDFVTYWWHRFQHESRIVWQFHKTHHSQKQLNVFTTFRVPIVDRLVALFTLALPAAVLQIDAALPFTIVAILLLHQLLIHSDTGLHFGPLERVFVSPSFHEVHHSTLEPHLDKNYGAVLAIWDHLFGTYVPRGSEPLRYGLVGEELPESFLRQQFVALAGLWQLARTRQFGWRVK